MEAFAARAVPDVLRVAGELTRAITLSFNTLSVAR
jgi:hypothetical protein